MKVKALKGTRCPKEGRPREYITDAKAEIVPDTVYYRRLVAEGSLILDSNPRKSAKSADDTKGGNDS